jgi:tetratricopeptide (TPR) repeat protein
MRRILALATALTVMLSFFGARALLAGADGEKPETQASRISTTAANIATLEQRVSADPTDVDAYVRLSTAYLQRSRETADPSYYALADTAVSEALALRPEDPNALVAAGTIAASKHDFTAALLYGGRAHEIEPAMIAAYSVIVDALVELGRYDEALAAAQEMADRRPDFAALSRISYLRELNGDLDGAIEAMRAAADAGTGVKQDRVWALVQLGALHLTDGDLDAAERAFDEAEALLPGDPMAQFGLARLDIARGDYAAAETRLRGAVVHRPLPEYLILLGEALEAQGKNVEAEEQYATVRAIQQLFAAKGVDTDLELALFDADRGFDPEATFENALASYRRRPTVYAADVVAWAAYKAGRLKDARQYMELALSLGTPDARLAYHAGVVSAASGDRASARFYFDRASEQRAALSPLYAEALDAIRRTRDCLTCGSCGGRAGAVRG